jgi:hypothetical protein
VAVPAPLALPTATGTVRARFTTRADGDLSADRLGPDRASARWQGVAGVPVTWLDQRHTNVVVGVERPAEHTGVVGDALVSACAGLGLAVWVGDCAPLLLVSDEGPFAVAHAGWRGLAAGVIGATVGALRGLGACRVHAWLGPCIRPCCYEFSASDLARLVARWGDAAVGRTAWGSDALDVPAAVRAELVRAGVGADAFVDVGACTGCDAAHYWSYRRRGDTGRHGLVAWREAAA